MGCINSIQKTYKLKKKIYTDEEIDNIIYRANESVADANKDNPMPQPPKFKPNRGRYPPLK